MRLRFAPLVPFALLVLLSACVTPPVETETRAVLPDFVQSHPVADLEVAAPTDSLEADAAILASSEPEPKAPGLAGSVLERGFTLVGTPYRYGGSSVKSGFDCSGFVGFLFRKEAGLQLPRSTRELINLDVPVVERDELVPGDVVFFNNRGRGRVSHAGIYIGEDQFIHASSSRSGGVRVDSLDDSYWRSSYIKAKRVLAMAPELASSGE